jgi:hypothetical protein
MIPGPEPGGMFFAIASKLDRHKADFGLTQLDQLVQLQ